MVIEIEDKETKSKEIMKNDTYNHVKTDLVGKTIIKAHLGDDIKKFSLHNDDLTYDELILITQRIFKDKINKNDEIILKYKDEDGDFITLSDDSELNTALESNSTLNLLINLANKELKLETSELKIVRKELQLLRDKITHLLDSIELKDFETLKSSQHNVCPTSAPITTLISNPSMTQQKIVSSSAASMPPQITPSFQQTHLIPPYQAPPISSMGNTSGGGMGSIRPTPSPTPPLSSHAMSAPSTHSNVSNFAGTNQSLHATTQSAALGQNFGNYPTNVGSNLGATSFGHPQQAGPPPQMATVSTSMNAHGGPFGLKHSQPPAMPTSYSSMSALGSNSGVGGPPRMGYGGLGGMNSYQQPQPNQSLGPAEIRPPTQSMQNQQQPPPANMMGMSSYAPHQMTPSYPQSSYMQQQSSVHGPPPPMSGAVMNGPPGMMTQQALPQSSMYNNPYPMAAGGNVGNKMGGMMSGPQYGMVPGGTNMGMSGPPPPPPS